MEENQNPTAPVVDEAAEDKEWDQAQDNFAKENDHKPEKEEEPKKPEVPENETEEEKKAREEKEAADKKAKGEEERANETPEQKAEREKKEKEAADAEAAKTETPGEQPDTRSVLREMAADEKAIKDDIREQMFSDVPTQLEDEDGDPIKSIDDLTGKRVNPKTGKAFTEEEAAAFLLDMNNKIRDRLTEVEKEVEQIAETNISIKEGSENIKRKYGELLKVNPNGVREKVWAAFERTLVVDEKTKIITKAPVPIEEFYDLALEPYAKFAEKLEADAAAEEARQNKDEEKDEELKRAKDNSDRADLTPGSASAGTDKEDEEWGKAAKAVFG